MKSTEARVAVPSSAVDRASYVLAAITLVAVLLLHLIPALFAGVVTFALIHAIAKAMAGRLSGHRGKLLAVALIALVVMGALAALAFGVFSLVKADAGVSALFQRMAVILENASMSLPAGIADRLPNGADELRTWCAQWLRLHSADMQLAGKEVGIGLAHTLIGMVIGALVAFHEASDQRRSGPLVQSLMARIRLFSSAFGKVVFAQVRISLINTALTAVYLVLLLPLFGVHLPFLKTMIALTFIMGLLPVVGNLVSNTVIFIVSIAQSLDVALASLAFLVIVHKAEYFLNARIIGNQIRAHAWELLLAMLLMESVFGLAGVVAAPVFYAYLKFELDQHGLI